MSKPSQSTPKPEATSGSSDATAGVKSRYSLVTAVFLIMGICIGSGIFFKSDNVLVATGGSVALGVAMFGIASVYIVFGGLTLSLFTARTDGAGGIIDYASRFVSPAFGHVMGIFYTFCYMPSIQAVIFWVTGVYACQALGLPDSLELQMGIGLAALLACSALNVLSPRLAGRFQDANTVLKVVPLLAVGAIGAFAVASGNIGAGDAAPAGRQAMAGAAGLSWLAAAGPVAYSFDGWTIATSIAPELRDSRRNLPIALVVAPLCILALYLCYFVGLSLTLGPERVMEAGDGSLGLFFSTVMGEGASRLPVFVAFLAVLGVGNGVTLGHARMPQALGLRGEIPHARWVARTDPHWLSPVNSSAVALASSLAWMVVHYLTQRHGLIPNGDVSEVTVSLCMLLMVPILLSAVRLWRRGEAGAVRGLLAPALGSAACLLVSVGALADPARLAMAGLVLVASVAATLVAASGSKREAVRG